jgi:hypothetical protein
MLAEGGGAMTRDQLEHVIGAAATIADDDSRRAMISSFIARDFASST